MDSIEYKDKQSRNVRLGYIQKEYPKIAQSLSFSITKLVDFYLDSSNIKKEDIILRLKDGVFLKKPLTNLNKTLPIDFRGIVSKLILTTDRRSWMIIKKDSVVVKGISNKPIDSSFYNLFNKINYNSKKAIITSLDKIRYSVLSSDNIGWFCFENGEHIVVPMKKMGLIKFNKTIFGNISINDIDKKYTWEEYIWPFCRSIIIHCSL